MGSSSTNPLSNHTMSSLFSTLTAAQQIEFAITGAASRSLSQHDRDHRQGLAYIWKNPQGKTPEEVFEILGPKGRALVEGSANCAVYLAAQYALAGGVPHPDGIPRPYVPPALPFGVSLTFNPDNSVRVVRSVVV